MKLEGLPIRMATEEELQRDPLHPHIKPKPPTRLMTLVVPGRRALGETFTKLEVGGTEDAIVIEASPTEAPADGRIMAVAGGDSSYSAYVLEKLRANAVVNAKGIGQMSYAEKLHLVNEAWRAFMEDKLRWHKGQSTFGLGGFTQRQRVDHPADRWQRDNKEKRQW